VFVGVHDILDWAGWLVDPFTQHLSGVFKGINNWLTIYSPIRQSLYQRLYQRLGQSFIQASPPAGGEGNKQK